MRKNKNLARLICGLLCLCICLSACKKEPAATTTKPAEVAPKDVIYTITLKTAGGMLLDNVSVYVYEDNTEDDLLTYGSLDNNGSFTFTAAESDKYTVRFANLPKEGYDVKDYYPITSTRTDITLTASVITGKDPLEEGKTYGLGDVMRDFTVTTVDGQELTLSKLLEEKDAVVLNFWYTGCNPCRNEFPLLQAAYETYSDRLEVITMNPTDISKDTAESIIAFRDELGLTMPMAVCSSKWFSAFGISAYPTTIVIDRYGVICLITGTIDEEGAFDSVFEHFTAENYEQKLVKDLSELHSVEYAEGHPRNPYQTHGAVGEFEVTVPAKSEFYVLLYKADGVTLHMEDPNLYVLYNEVRYEPNSKGVIEVVIENEDMMTGSSVVIGNTGVTDAVVKVKVMIPQGTLSTPYEGSLGSVTVNVSEGNDQGVYYSWIAEADGVLKLTVTNAPATGYDVQLFNTSTMAVRNLTDEPQLDDDGNPFVTVDVRAGDEIRIGYMSTPDENNHYPAVTIGAELTFEEIDETAVMYTVTVVDGDGNPIANVEVSVMIDGADTKFFTDAEGKVTMELVSGLYTVKVAVPEDYTCEITQFLLTATNPAVEVVMQKYVPQELPYTLYVVDDTGAPMANVEVTFNGTVYYTDANGMVSVILVESDAYTATVTVPEGYILENNEVAFGTETTLTVTIYRDPEEFGKIAYTVTTVDQNGKPYTGVQVQVVSEDGSVSATVDVDANGKATFKLPETNYNVTILCSGDNLMGYEPIGMKLTPDKTDLTVKLVPYVSGEPEIIFVQGADADAYNVAVGSYYVDLTQVTTRYFLFTPERDGIYAITTTNANAAVGYWGSPFFTYDGSSAIVNNTYTFEVKQIGPTIVVSVTGGEGITGTVLKITRVSDPKPDPEYVSFEGSSTPTEIFVANETGTKTYLDISVENTLVKGADGFYHWGAEDGPIVYMDLKGARYNISMAALVDVTSLHKYEYDANGNPVRRIDYTECMLSYIQCADQKLGVYALTDDLITIIQEHGNDAGWYDKDGHGYLFGYDSVHPDSAWMFLLCTFQ